MKKKCLISKMENRYLYREIQTFHSFYALKCTSNLKILNFLNFTFSKKDNSLLYGNRWTRNPKTRNIRRLLDNSRNHTKLIWISSHVGIGENEVADQAAKDALNEEIGNQEPYPPQDLMKWMKKEEFNNRQKRWGRGENDMNHRKVSVSKTTRSN
jgi:ribonuclease HI